MTGRPSFVTPTATGDPAAAEAPALTVGHGHSDQPALVERADEPSPIAALALVTGLPPELVRACLTVWPEALPTRLEEAEGAPPTIHEALEVEPIDATLTVREEPEVSRRVRRAGYDTLTLETNAARAPIVTARTEVTLQWRPLPMYGVSFAVRQSKGSLTPRDQRLLTEFCTAYVRDGCPEHRRVPFALAGAARLLGYSGTGQHTRHLVKESVRRLVALRMESTVRYTPEGRSTESVVLGWGFLSAYRIANRGELRGGSVTLTDEFARLLRAGSVTFLHQPTYDALLGDDDLAARLWTFLESETLPRSYSLFAAPPGETSPARNLAAIYDLLRATDSNRARFAARIARAAQAIERHDGRYRVHVAKSPASGMWRLQASRRANFAYREGPNSRTGKDQLRVSAPDQDGGLPSHSYRRECTVVENDASPEADRCPLSPADAPIMNRQGKRSEAARRADGIEAVVGRLYLLNGAQRRRVEAVESRGIMCGCTEFDHWAIVQEAVEAICPAEDAVGEGRGGGRIGEEVSDPLEALFGHDQEAHPWRSKPERVNEQPQPPEILVDDVEQLVAGLPNDVADQVRELAFAGEPVEAITDRLGLSLWSSRGGGEQFLRVGE